MTRFTEMKIKTAELMGAALDWGVAKAEDRQIADPELADSFIEMRQCGHFNYSTDWSQGGPIIEREKITLRTNACIGGHWVAFIDFGGSNTDVKARQSGATPLIAAMRCHAASKLGDEIEVPTEIASL